MWHHQLISLLIFPSLIRSKVKLCKYPQDGLFWSFVYVLEGASSMSALSGPKNGRSGRLTPLMIWKQMLLGRWCPSAARREKQLFQKWNIFSSLHKTFVSPLNPSKLMTTSQKRWRHQRPEKTGKTISVTISEIQKLKDTSNMLRRCSHSPIFFLPFFSSSHPSEQTLCWSRRVVTDASSQRGRRREKSENTVED